MSNASLELSNIKWELQRAIGDKLGHSERCASIAGDHHPLAGPNLLCDCGAVDKMLSAIKAESALPTKPNPRDVNFGDIFDCQ